MPARLYPQKKKIITDGRPNWLTNGRPDRLTDGQLLVELWLTIRNVLPKKEKKRDTRKYRFPWVISNDCSSELLNILLIKTISWTLCGCLTVRVVRDNHCLRLLDLFFLVFSLNCFLVSFLFSSSSSSSPSFSSSSSSSSNSVLYPFTSLLKASKSISVFVRWCVWQPPNHCPRRPKAFPHKLLLVDLQWHQNLAFSNISISFMTKHFLCLRPKIMSSTTPTEQSTIDTGNP